MTAQTKNIDMRSEQVASVALSTFFNIMHEWKVSEAQQIQILGTPSSKTFKNWQSSSFLPLNSDTLTRVSYIITIYKNLGLLFPTREQANDWVYKPNKYLKGDSAITLISSGDLNKMHQIAEYLNAQVK